MRSINLRVTGATTKVHDDGTLSEIWMLTSMNDLSQDNSQTLVAVAT